MDSPAAGWADDDDQAMDDAGWAALDEYMIGEAPAGSGSEGGFSMDSFPSDEGAFSIAGSDQQPGEEVAEAFSAGESDNDDLDQDGEEGDGTEGEGDDDAASEEEEDDEDEDADAEGAAELSHEELKAQIYGLPLDFEAPRSDSPLRSQLAFRKGSYARYCRPDSPDGDLAKANLIEQSDDAWGPLMDPGSPDAWRVRSWVKAEEQRDGKRKVKRRVKSAKTREGRERETRGMVQRALAKAGAAAARRPQTSPAVSQQFELDGAPSSKWRAKSASAARRKDWGPSAPRRHSSPSRMGATPTAAECSGPRQKKGQASVRLMRWSSTVEPDAREGKKPPTKTVPREAAPDPKADLVQQLYKRRQRIAKRAQARLDTRVSQDSTTRLADILGPNDKTVAKAKAAAAATTPEQPRPRPTVVPAVQWRHGDREQAGGGGSEAALTRGGPKPALGKPLPAAAAAPSAQQGPRHTPSRLAPANPVSARPLNMSAAAMLRSSPPSGDASGSLANLTNRVGSAAPTRFADRPSTGQRPPVHSHTKPPAQPQRPPSGAAARTVVVRRGRVPDHGPSMAGAGREQRPLSAGPFYPEPKAAARGPSAGAVARRPATGLSEAAVAAEVAREAARRNAELLGSCGKAGRSLRPKTAPTKVKRPLVVRPAQRGEY